ncbi:MAG: hypothetical protein CM1200mP14_29220 [Gammaproteobacteria bacterium]|nr:MAG: hypothetical protein CM1200mP14_29220 [Gammaproteobacteria bacterium]
MAGPTVFLASEAASYVTGTVLLQMADGRQSMAFHTPGYVIHSRSLRLIRRATGLLFFVTLARLNK